jgi:CHAT domain-containing protein
MDGNPPRVLARVFLLTAVALLPAQLHAQPASDVRQLIAAERFQDAEQAARQRVAALDASGAGNTADMADALDDLAYAMPRVGQFTNALPIAARAVALRDQLGDRRGLIGSLLQQQYLAELRDTRTAETAARRAFALAEELLPPDHPQRFESHLGIIGIAFWAGRLEETVERLGVLLAEERRVLPSDAPVIVRTIADLVLSLQTLRRFEEGRHAAAEGVQLAERNGDVFHAGLFWTRLGQILTEIGDYAAARTALNRAVEFRRRSPGAESVAMGGVLTHLGTLQAMVGDHRGAVESFERAASMAPPTRVALLANPSRHASSLIALGEFEQAIAILRALLPTADRVPVPHPNTALLYGTLAEALLAAGRGAEAKPYAQQALAIRLELNIPYGAAHSYSTIAKIAVAAGDGAAAREAYEESLRMFARIAPTPHMRNVQSEFAEFLARSGDLAGAEVRAGEASGESFALFRLALQGLPERQAVTYAQTHRRNLDLLVSLLEEPAAPAPASIARAFDLTVRSRAIVLDEVARRQQRLASADARAVRNRLTAARERLARLVVRGPEGPIEEFEQIRKAAQAEADRAEEALAAVSVSAQQAREADRADAATVVAALGPADALVAFVKYSDVTAAADRERYGAFVIAPGRPTPAFVRLGAARVVEDAIAATRRELLLEARAQGRASARLLASYRAAASGLRRLIWDPVSSQFPAATRAFIVPDGALHLVNFAALPVGSTQFLIERGPTLHYLAAERDLLTGSRENRAGGLLAIGNPGFDDRAQFAADDPSGSSTLRATCGDYTNMRFAALPASGNEARSLTALWSQSPAARPARGAFALLQGAAASETALKQQASSYRVLHLATHGFFLGDNCVDPNAPGVRVTGTAPPAPDGSNPLLLSGVALAGANHRLKAGPTEDDGVLTAAEIAGLDLHGLEWAVLSACDTGLGSITAGEGVFGLQRAFRVAGASTVIMSLWPVDDRSTRDWMVGLYRARLHANQNTADAVRSAARGVLAARRKAGLSAHPFYWGAFVASGDWR